MLVMEFGIVTLVRSVQPEKARSPMLVTELGIVTLVRLMQVSKASSPMPVTPSGITTSPPLPLYLVSTPSTMVKSPPAACAIILPAPLGRKITSIARINTSDMALFFAFFMSLKYLLCNFDISLWWMIWLKQLTASSLFFNVHFCKTH